MTDVVVCLKDTDVFVLLVFPYALTKINEMWVMKIESRKCINIMKIVESLATGVTTKLPQIHAVTGCDTAFFANGVAKIKVIKSVYMGKKNSGF